MKVGRQREGEKPLWRHAGGKPIAAIAEVIVDLEPRVIIRQRQRRVVEALREFGRGAIRRHGQTTGDGHCLSGAARLESELDDSPLHGAQRGGHRL